MRRCLFDVSVQKARTAAFYSGANAGALLRAAGLGSYVDRAAADGLKLDGSVAFTDRAGDFCIDRFSGRNQQQCGRTVQPRTERMECLQCRAATDLIKTGLQTVLSGSAAPCTSIPSLPNGIQFFPAVCLYTKMACWQGGLASAVMASIRTI
jgi:hypothetical protein